MNIKTVQVHVEEASLDKTMSVGGYISFKFGEFWFPGNRWYDFPLDLLGNWLHILTRVTIPKQYISKTWPGHPVKILKSWLHAIRRIIIPNGHIAILMFMDGPYHVAATVNQQMMCHIECVKRNMDEQNIVYECNVSLQQMLQEMLDASERLLVACGDKGWQDDNDVKYLEAETAKAKKFLCNLSVSSMDTIPNSDCVRWR